MKRDIIQKVMEGHPAGKEDCPGDKFRITREEAKQTAHPNSHPLT